MLCHGNVAIYYSTPSCEGQQIWLDHVCGLFELLNRLYMSNEIKVSRDLSDGLLVLYSDFNHIRFYGEKRGKIGHIMGYIAFSMTSSRSGTCFIWYEEERYVYRIGQFFSLNRVGSKVCWFKTWLLFLSLLLIFCQFVWL